MSDTASSPSPAGPGAVRERLTGLSNSEPTEAEIVDNHRLDHLYTNAFRDGSGKYFTVVSRDEDGTPSVIEAEHPEVVKNKIKTRLTFIKDKDGKGGKMSRIELKRFKYYKNKGYVEQEECITFTFPFFIGLIGFLQSLAGLNLNDITERRIPLHDGPALDETTKKQFYTLAATPEGQELIREAVRNGHVSGADIANIAYRKDQLKIFEEMMDSADAVAAYRAKHEIKKLGDEAIWQHFFEANTWIFGYGLNFVFNQPLEGKKLELAVRGPDIGGPGKTSDGVLKTAGIVSSICLVEIKTPGTRLLDSEAYRPDCWQPSHELGGGISQSQKTVQKTLENLGPEMRPTDKGGDPTGEVIYAYKPKAFLIVGRLNEFRTEAGTNREKFASFELLRRNTISPEIITFDELLERARFIVSIS